MGSKRGITGEFAAILRELEDCPDMAFGCITPDGRLTWIHIPHEIGDGMMGMQDLMTREGYTLGPTPQGRPVKGNRLWLLFKLLIGPKVPKRGRRIPWKDFDRAAPAERPEPAWTVVDEAHTVAIARAAKECGASANSLMLWALDRAVEPLLSDPTRARMWLVRVNMRGVVKLPPDASNQTSEIPCVIRHGSTPRDVHEEITSRLSRKMHVFNLWIRRYLLWRMSREKLLKAIRYARANKRQYWVGCFSNVGEWSPPGGAEGVTWCAVDLRHGAGRGGDDVEGQTDDDLRRASRDSRPQTSRAGSSQRLETPPDRTRRTKPRRAKARPGRQIRSNTFTASC